MRDLDEHQVTLSLAQVRELAQSCLRKCGASEEHARTVADVVTSAERDDCKSHGLFRLPGFCASLRSGTVTGDAVPELQEVSPAVLQVNAHNGFAPLALEVGCAPLAAKARTLGLAALAVTNSYHFSALWPEVERLTDIGLVAFAFVSSPSFVAPAGGKRPLYGTNPMAFGWPRAEAPAVIFDQASSASARGEIQLHERDGRQLPDGWAINAEGQPTNDPTAALAGAQLPFGGYKGAAIAMMIELLAGALIGDVLSFEASASGGAPGGPASGGEFMIAIDPARCGQGPGVALAHAESLFTEILSEQGTRLPSDRRYAARRRTAQAGVTVNRALHEELLRI
ncbi:MAG: Ldh family oxidoreductase [Pseudomonadales bacterium]